MKKFIDYCKYSGVWISIAFNPFHWRVSIKNESGQWPSDYLRCYSIQLLAVSIKIVIDDGNW
jgi:hypothetical protein